MFWYIIHGKCCGCTLEFSFCEAILNNQWTVKSQNRIHWNPNISKYQATEKKGYLLYQLFVVSWLHHVKNNFHEVIVGWPFFSLWGVFYPLSFLPGLWLVISWKQKSNDISHIFWLYMLFSLSWLQGLSSCLCCCCFPVPIWSYIKGQTCKCWLSTR